MAKILFIWNIAGVDGNIGSYRPSVYAAKSIGYDIDIAMNFSRTSLEKRKEIEENLGVKLIHIDINQSPYSLKNIHAAQQLIGIMKEGDYEIIHCNTPVGSILGRIVAYKLKHRRVFYMNRGFSFYENAPLKNWIFYYTVEKVLARLFTDAIATINPDDYEYAVRFKLRKGSEMKYLIPGPGVELSRFHYDDFDRKTIREEFGIMENDILILSVGDISERKNFISIVEALEIVNKKYNLNNFCEKIYYMIVGEGPCKEMICEHAKLLGISDNIIFAGYQENVSRFYSAADIFAIPSLSEGFGRVGIEAMNVGLPLITSSIQGINMYSINGKTGYKCESKDVDGYAKGIVELIKNSEKRELICEHNRQFAKEFSMEKSGKVIAQIYQQLLKIDY